MIDTEYKVRRYIAEYSEESEKLIAEYDLSSFELESFQREFGESDSRNPMFDCYPITKLNINFIKNHVEKEPEWDFANKSYFVEAYAI